MSRRFGRNQRRRAREAIAQAEQRHAAAMALIGQQRNALRESKEKIKVLEEVIDGARLALGDYTVALDPQFYLSGFNYRPTLDLPEPLRVVPAFDPKVSPITSIRHVVAGVLDVQVHQQHWARQQHVRVRFKDEALVAYAVEERTLRTGGREFLERHLARILALSLVEHFQPKGSSRHG